MQLHQFSQHARSAQLTRQRILRSGLTLNGHRLWSPEEDEVIRRYYPDFDKLAGLLPDRTYVAIRHRSQIIGVARKKPQWLAIEVAKLRKYYPTAPKAELLRMFVGSSWFRITNKARQLNLRRKKKCFRPTGFPVIDQIRARCFELNLSMVDLDEMAGTKKYFQTAGWYGHEWVSGEYVRRAVEALDGTLEAKWSEDDEANAVALRPAA